MVNAKKSQVAIHGEARYSIREVSAGKRKRLSTQTCKHNSGWYRGGIPSSLMWMKEFCFNLSSDKINHIDEVSMVTTKKKAVKKKTTAKKTPAKPAKKLIKKAVKTTRPVKKPSSKGKKVFSKKTSAKSTPKPKKAATPRKLTQKEKMLIEGIRSVKTMAIIVPPIPSGKDIVSIKPEPSKTGVFAEKPHDDKSYNPRAMEQKWQEKWETDKLYRALSD